MAKKMEKRKKQEKKRESNPELTVYRLDCQQSRFYQLPVLNQSDL
jgi:hypothetical protein